jgi:hypothetical protein
MTYSLTHCFVNSTLGGEDLDRSRKEDSNAYKRRKTISSNQN